MLFGVGFTIVSILLIRHKTKSVLPDPVLPQQIAVKGCLNGSRAIDFVLCLAVATAAASVVVVVVVVFTVYSVTMYRFFSSERQ